MWRTNKPQNDDFFAEHDSGYARVERQVTAPHALTLGDPNYSLSNVAEPTWRGWRSELAGIGGASPLLHFVDGPRTRIELGATHPGGLAQFITGKSTLLSNLIRDDIALRAAKLAAAEIADKSLELATARGIDSIHLGIGIAEWCENIKCFFLVLDIRESQTSSALSRLNEAVALYYRDVRAADSFNNKLRGRHRNWVSARAVRWKQGHRLRMVAVSTSSGNASALRGVIGAVAVKHLPAQGPAAVPVKG